MKTHKLIGVLFLSLLFTGCDDFLEQEPQGKEASTAYMNTEENAENAVTSMYNMLIMVSGGGPDGNWIDTHMESFFGSIASDDAEKGSENSDLINLTLIANYQMAPSNPIVRTYYTHGFWAISRANYVLDNLIDAPFDEKVKTRMRGEALFFRAYYYFYLLRHFGGMPLFSSSVKMDDFGNVPRASIAETFDFIINDFKEAITLLPDKYPSSQTGKATKGAARAFLARVMVYRMGIDAENTGTTWQDVYDQTSAIINSGQYDLLPNYAELFEEETKNCVESIFELQAKSGTGGVGLFMFWFVEGNRTPTDGAAYGWGFHNPTQDLVDAFDPTDPRLSCTIYGLGYNRETLYGITVMHNRSQQMSAYHNRKTAMPTMPVDWTSGKQWMVIRYADVLLMHAEACYWSGNESEAKTMLNKIRARARNSSYCKGYTFGDPQGYPYPTTTPNIPDCNASGEALYNAILDERRVELALENHRTWDLIRTGRLVDRVELVKDFARDPNNAKYNTTNSANLEVRVPGIRSNIIKSSLIGKDGKYIPVMPLPETEVNYWSLAANPF
ncbi:RagB/SusD family nutrient uptake outer membrane protein [termite gut metagenome]|uniref:RagB/SusD family nutrient uptake outer membrane protein n=1 Tax=termite gut metagenome TaxID=433724 RepID=A0A5J4R7S4_9ZZZZ